MEDHARKVAESEWWYWWGIPTMFRAPWNPDPSACDVALVGVPHSVGNGSTERDQHLGPRFLRHVSGFYRRAHRKWNFSPWDTCRIHDLGDVPLPEAMVNEACNRDMHQFFRDLDVAGVYPVSIGGDHGITGPILKAIAGPDARLTGGRKAAILHFDAHRDDYDHAHWLGNHHSAADWAAWLVKEGHVDADRSIQVGMRGNPMHVFHGDATKKITDVGHRMVDMDEVLEIGLPGVIDLARDRIGDAPLYITFDLDVLDPCDAPGVANVEPGYQGLRVFEAIRILQGIRGLNVIGGDVVCPMPTKDSPNNITSMNAMVVMFEILCLLVDRRFRAGP